MPPLALLTLAAAATTLSYGAHPKQRVDVYVATSATVAAKTKPVAVFFHGGVWQRGDRADWSLFGEELARRGFVAVIASYRLAPDVRWPAPAEDAAAVVDLALREAARFGGDPARLVVVGHSAGAQMAAMLAYDARFLAARGRSPKDIRALALLSGIFDLNAPVDEGQPDGGLRAFVAPTFDDERARSAASPLTHARSNNKSKLGVPLLLVTSENDYLAMRAQTFAMARALQAGGEAVSVVDVPGVDHFGIVSSVTTWERLGLLAGL